MRFLFAGRNAQRIAIGGSVKLRSGAAVTLNADGTITYLQNGVHFDLDPGETAEDALVYRVSDGKTGVAMAAAYITVEGATGDVL